MPAITVTADNVEPTEDATSVSRFIAGEALTEGVPIYQSGTQVFKAQNDTSAKSKAVGITISHASGAGVPIYAVTKGKYKVGGTVTKGKTYSVGDAAGDILAEDELTTNDWVSTLGVASSSSEIDVNLVHHNIQRA